MPKAPTLKELLDTRKTNHATSILVSTTNKKDLFKGNISELSEELLNIPIFALEKTFAEAFLYIILQIK